MAEKSYEELILEILYVDGRISKAKAIGIAAGLVLFICDMIYIIPHSLRAGVLPFLITMLFVFFQIVLYYSICRGAGYLIRRFLIK
jgi:5,10-methenyltetrahydromethanopterin hydrogenase